MKFISIGKDITSSGNNGKPYTSEEVAKFDLLHPLLPWANTEKNEHKEVYDINGHYYNELKKGTYLIYVKQNINDNMLARVRSFHEKEGSCKNRRV